MAVHRNAEERIITYGLEAWSRVEDHLSFNAWMDIAEALHVGRLQSMREANCDRPKGRFYNEALSRWLNNHTMKVRGERIVTFATIDQGTRSRLDRIRENRVEVERWRATLSIKERGKTNSPSSVWNKWQAAVGKATPAPDGEPDMA